jgi:uncharacterized membrane protein YcfT
MRGLVKSAESRTPEVANVTLPFGPRGHHRDMKQRIDWIDLVKATSVLLVVFMHATNTMVDLAGPSGVGSFLHVVNAVIEPLRMPVFFLVSGMLAASAIKRPWRASTGRTSGMIYLYVLWMVLFMGMQALFGVTANEPVTAIIFARSGYWYLYAMALFFVIAKLLRNQPAWVVVAVAVVPNLLRPFVGQFFEGIIPGSLYTSMAMNLFFFLLGAYFKDIVAAVAHAATWKHTLVLGAVGIPFGVFWMTSPEFVGQTYFPVSVVLVAFGISLAVQVTRTGAPEWASFIGARTLPIYVWQWPILFLVSMFLPAAALAHPIAQLLFPFLVTAVVGVTAVWLHGQSFTKHLFAAPEWVTHPQDIRLRTPETVTVGR